MTTTAARSTSLDWTVKRECWSDVFPMNLLFLLFLFRRAWRIFEEKLDHPALGYLLASSHFLNLLSSYLIVWKVFMPMKPHSKDSLGATESWLLAAAAVAARLRDCSCSTGLPTPNALLPSQNQMLQCIHQQKAQKVQPPQDLFINNAINNAIGIANHQRSFW